MEGLKGPDLVRPKPELRIVPGKLSGSPHVAGTRVETTAIAALAKDGLDTERIISGSTRSSTRRRSRTRSPWSRSWIRT
jgi:hypothetical protein